MRVPGSAPPGPTAQARASLHAGLHERRGEIEEAILSRAYGVSDPGETADPEYVRGLRAAVAAAIDYGLAGVERGERNPPTIPAVLLAQARVAARNGVGLDTVLRRYFAGYILLGDALIEEVETGGLLSGDDLKRLLRAQAPLFDRLLAAVSKAHTHECESRVRSPSSARSPRPRGCLRASRSIQPSWPTTSMLGTSERSWLGH